MPPTEAPTEVPTATPTPEALLPLPTARVFPTVDIGIGQPTVEPTTAPTEAPPVPAALTLPALATFDDGASGLVGDGGLDAGGARGGQAWMMSSTRQPKRLTWQSALDLTTAAAPLLTFQSQFAGAGVASVLVSTDGGATWQTAAVVPNSADWTPVSVDLSAYAGSTIRLAFDWQGSAGDRGQSTRCWLPTRRCL